MELSVSEYAKQEHVSERRVRQLAAEGRLPARRIGRSWIIDGQSAPRGRPAVRPMSRGNAWDLARRLFGEDTRALRQDRYRGMVERLRSSNHPEQLLSAWLAKRAERRSYNVQPPDLEDLRNDPRLCVSGVSHEASGLLAAREVEAYVPRKELDGLTREFLLTSAPAGKGNVLLRIVEEMDDVPLAFVVADLAERPGVRERQTARALLAERLRNA